MPHKRRYDDDAFQRDLELAAKAAGTALDSNTNDVDVKQIIKSALQVEDESRQIKYPKVNSEALYRDFKISKKFKPPEIKDRNLKKVQDQLISSKGKFVCLNRIESDMDETKLAFALLDRYKRDKNFIAKDVEKTKKKSEFILDCEQGSNKVKKADPLRTQEERHAAIKEKREKRKEEQAKKLALEEENKRNAIAKRQEARRRPSQQPTQKPAERPKVVVDASIVQANVREMQEEIKRYKESVKRE